MNSALSRVQRAYASRAAEYSRYLGHIDALAEWDKELIASWGETVQGPILDVGCGPGQWTKFLVDRGKTTFAIDPVPEFIAHASRSYPSIDFLFGQAERLPVSDGSLGGILAWYSLIHMTPENLPMVLTGFHRALRPGGTLILGFFIDAKVEQFDHAIAPAYFWPFSYISQMLEESGFTVTHFELRQDEDARPHGALIAKRK